MEHSAGTGVFLFGSLCSQTVPSSNYVYIELSARLDASAALGCLHGLLSTPLVSKGQRVQMSRRRFTYFPRMRICTMCALALYSTDEIESRTTRLARSRSPTTLYFSPLLVATSAVNIIISLNTRSSHGSSIDSRVL